LVGEELSLVDKIVVEGAVLGFFGEEGTARSSFERAGGLLLVEVGDVPLSSTANRLEYENVAIILAKIRLFFIFNYCHFPRKFVCILDKCSN
jgi:hypothetical protein